MKGRKKVCDDSDEKSQLSKEKGATQPRAEVIPVLSLFLLFRSRQEKVSQVHRPTKIQLWKFTAPKGISPGQMESAHLPPAPYPVLLPQALGDVRPLPAALPAHSSLGFPGPASSQAMAGGQQAPAVTRAQGSLSSEMIPVTSRSHLAATCRELLSQTWLDIRLQLATGLCHCGQVLGTERSCCKGTRGLEWPDTDLEGVGQARVTHLCAGMCRDLSCLCAGTGSQG